MQLRLESRPVGEVLIVQCHGRIVAGNEVFTLHSQVGDSIDKYGRTLAYVWTELGRLFNLDMIADGYAHEYTYYVPYRYQQEFKAAQSDARTQERGLWSPKACAA